MPELVHLLILSRTSYCLFPLARIPFPIPRSPTAISNPLFQILISQLIFPFFLFRTETNNIQWARFCGYKIYETYSVWKHIKQNSQPKTYLDVFNFCFHFVCCTLQGIDLSPHRRQLRVLRFQLFSQSTHFWVYLLLKFKLVILRFFFQIGKFRIGCFCIALLKTWNHNVRWKSHHFINNSQKGAFKSGRWFRRLSRRILRNSRRRRVAARGTWLSRRAWWRDSAPPAPTRPSPPPAPHLAFQFFGWRRTSLLGDPRLFCNVVKISANTWRKVQMKLSLKFEIYTQREKLTRSMSVWTQQ